MMPGLRRLTGNQLLLQRCVSPATTGRVPSGNRAMHLASRRGRRGPLDLTGHLPLPHHRHRRRPRAATASSLSHAVRPRPWTTCALLLSMGNLRARVAVACLRCPSVGSGGMRAVGTETEDIYTEQGIRSIDRSHCLADN